MLFKAEVTSDIAGAHDYVHIEAEDRADAANKAKEVFTFRKLCPDFLYRYSRIVEKIVAEKIDDEDIDD